MDPKQKQPETSSLLQTPPILQPEQDTPPPPETIPEIIIEPRQDTIPEPPVPPPPPVLPEPEPETNSLPPLVSPPAKKKGLPKALFGIAALLLLVVSIPVGIFLVRQTQELRTRAFEAADCDTGDRGGLKETAEDCDANINELVQVFVCNNTERLPGSPTGRQCAEGTVPPPEGPTAPSLIPSEQDGSGGCCNAGAADNSSEGCRVGSGFREVCDISNGACQSGFSCRSIAGCAKDSDCGPGNECKNSKCEAIPPPSDQYTSCSSWGYSDDSTNTADPNCEKAPQNGFSCNKPDGRAVCCYKDGNCYEGQQGSCKNLGNGTIELGATATVIEFQCPSQTSSTGSCSEGRITLGTKGPGTYTVGGSTCGGHQIDAVGYCGSYVFRGSCTPPQGREGPGPPPQVFLFQCLNVKFYDTNWNLISNPATQIRANQPIKITVAGQTNEPGGLTAARFRINGEQGWRQTNRTIASGEFHIDYTALAGALRVEAQVFNPTLGWR